MKTTSDNAQIPIRDLVLAIVRHGATDTWADWIPLSIAAAKAPDQWIETVRGLELEQQLKLLTLLADAAAGPVADALLLHLAAQAHILEDDQVRYNTLDYAAAAYERRGQQLDWLQDQFQSLTTGVEHARQRMREGFDLAGEMTRLEKELAILRSKDNLEDRFREIHTLESEIFRLEILKRSLTRYEQDRPRREAYLTELQQETEKLNLRKKELEETIATKLVEVNRQREETAVLEKTQRDAQDEQERLERIKREIEQSLATLQKECDDLKARKAMQDKERQTLLGKVEALQREVADKDNLIRTERKNLEELRIEADRSQDREVMGKIDELYRMLPADRADEVVNVR